LGRYGIVAIIDGEEHFAGFEVAEYRKPEFEVKVTTDKPYYLVGERMKVSIKATYFFWGACRRRASPLHRQRFAPSLVSLW
jgi:uncharacterized protein YfaS (alpha-2-macroglobulin family)